MVDEEEVYVEEARVLAKQDRRKQQKAVAKEKQNWKRIGETLTTALDYKKYNSKVLGLEKEEGIYINKYKTNYEKVFTAVKNTNYTQKERNNIIRGIDMMRSRAS